MRQQGMCDEDQRFRTALENLRYKSCSEADISLLRSRIAGPLPHQPKLTDIKYRGVPIVTPRNAHRDKINEMGAIRFATDSNQELVTFRSRDKYARTQEFISVRKTQKAHNRALDPIRKSNTLSPDIQQMVWDLPPCATGQHAGFLSICLGMPVMLKYNEATELCATNGAEAVVVGWKEAPSSDGHRYLDTIFVKLQNPPRVQRLPGLPKNVIPIVAATRTVKCDLLDKNDNLRIERRQVQVLLNFAMTDFQSQGRTRPINPVDLYNCSGFQSAYTCLSRGTSLSSTIIIQPFKEDILKGGAPGHIRAEFRELEILDHIGYLRHKGMLHREVRGETRLDLIKSYERVYGKRCVPENVHSKLDWTSWDKDDLRLPEDLQNWKQRKLPPQEVDMGCNTGGTKRKIPDSGENIQSSPKRPRIKSHDATAMTHFQPIGCRWDSENYSCAYDSVIFILYNLCVDLGKSAFKQLMPSNDISKILRRKAASSSSLHTVSNMEETRECIRDHLSSVNIEQFPRYGHVYSSAAAVASFFAQKKRKNSLLTRSCCGLMTQKRITTGIWHVGEDTYKNSVGLHFGAEETVTKISSSQWIRLLTHKYNTSKICSSCRHSIIDTISIQTPPGVMIICLPDSSPVKTSVEKTMTIPDRCPNIEWRLRGAVYYKPNHFVARYIDGEGVPWYQDGMASE
ncbi:hypothetical protein PUNSTDRAFT_36801, partial [Punctularia strigosozonata HHB-11173 SS5]